MNRIFLEVIVDTFKPVEFITLGWISRRCDVGMWTGLGWPRVETGGVRL